MQRGYHIYTIGSITTAYQLIVDKEKLKLLICSFHFTPVFNAVQTEKICVSSRVIWPNQKIFSSHNHKFATLLLTIRKALQHGSRFVPLCVQNADTQSDKSFPLQLYETRRTAIWIKIQSTILPCRQLVEWREPEHMYNWLLLAINLIMAIVLIQYTRAKRQYNCYISGDV